MVAYTVHEALIPPRELAQRGEDIVFVKEGFSWPAFFAPLPWLLYQRLWLEALAWFVGMAALFALAGGTQEGQAGESGLNVLVLLLNALLGFVANDLRRWALERRGRPLVAVVSGARFDDCERRFFESWLPYAREDQARRWGNPSAPRPSWSGLSGGEATETGAARSGGETVIGFAGIGG